MEGIEVIAEFLLCDAVIAGKHVAVACLVEIARIAERRGRLSAVRHASRIVVEATALGRKPCIDAGQSGVGPGLYARRCRDGVAVLVENDLPQRRRRGRGARRVGIDTRHIGAAGSRSARRLAIRHPGVTDA